MWIRMMASTAIVVILLGFGMLFGGIGVATYLSADDFLTDVGKIQAIPAAAIALAAAVTAYIASSQRLRFDRGNRKEDQRSRIHSIAEEANTRNSMLIDVSEVVMSHWTAKEQESFADAAKASFKIFDPFVKQAVTRLPELWNALENTPPNLRTDAIQLLLSHELVVIRSVDLAETLRIWAALEPAKAAKLEDIPVSFLGHCREEMMVNSRQCEKFVEAVRRYCN